MKPICKNYFYDDEFFAGKLPPDKVPPEVRYLPEPSHDFPMFLEDSFISGSDCSRLVEKLKAAEPKCDATAISGGRSAKYYRLPWDEATVYEQAFLRTKPKIEAFFKATILNSEGAHALGYKVGDGYGMHTDNCQPVCNASGEVLGFDYFWKKRQISTLLFLTDSVMDITGDSQCIGGNLSFPCICDLENETLLIEPRVGLFIAFPSNPIYMHQVHEILEGSRFAVADWHSAIFHNPRLAG